MDFKDRIKQARAKKGYSQSALAKLVGVHVTNISRYERGENRPTSDVLTRLADVLEVSTDFLMNGTNEEWVEQAGLDKEIVLRFKAIQQMETEDKKTVLALMDAFIAKEQIQRILS